MVEWKECEHLGLRVEKRKIGENHDSWIEIFLSVLSQKLQAKLLPKLGGKLGFPPNTTTRTTRNGTLTVWGTTLGLLAPKCECTVATHSSPLTGLCRLPCCQGTAPNQAMGWQYNTPALKEACLLRYLQFRTPSPIHLDQRELPRSTSNCT